MHIQSVFFSFLSSWKDKCIRVAFLYLWGNYVLYTLQLWFWVLCLISFHRQSANWKGGGGDGLWGRGSESVGEDDAVPGLVGRGHSSAALHHEKGQLRTGQAASSRYLVTEMRRNCERPDFGLIFLWAAQMGRLSWETGHTGWLVCCRSLQTSDCIHWFARDENCSITYPTHNGG